MRLKVVGLAGALALAAGLAGVARAQDAAIGAARSTADEWLALLDGQQYEQTWEKAGALLKAAVDEAEWTRKMSVTLGPLGQAEARAVRSSEYSTTMPGAPDGEYVTLKFDSTFRSKQTALETLVLRKEPDGTWRVSGYFIR